MTREIMHFMPSMDIDRFFGEEFFGNQNFAPAIDIYQDNDDLIVETSLPGIDPENVDISVENDVLTMSGETKDKKEIKREDFYRKEIREGSFSRSVILPVAVKGSEAQAEYDNGVLKVVLPKAEDAKPKKISVNIKKK
ncbi:MAG: molecular chaperone [Candidatus Moraniibacteriota bacterium]|nr:MAG: molecular chaperone [Candidatus Moranbacteria bacterium]